MVTFLVPAGYVNTTPHSAVHNRGVALAALCSSITASGHSVEIWSGFCPYVSETERYASVARVISAAGLVSVEGVAKFTQNWFPLALVAMAQAILMLTGGISLAIGAMVSLGAVLAATTMDGPLGVAGGVRRWR